MKQICFAAFSGTPPQDLISKSLEVVDLLTQRCEDLVVLVGGYWGLMKYVVDRALEKGVSVVIIPPLDREHHDFPSRAIVIKPGVDYRVRSVFLVRSCDALIALGGEAGTIQEIVTAYVEGVPIYVLRSGLSSDKLEMLGPYLDRRALTKIKFFSDPKALVDEVLKEVCSEAPDSS